MSNQSFTPDWMPELFFCHRYKFAYVAHNLGFRIGTRSDHFDTNRVEKTLNSDIPVSFIDNNFKNPDKERLCDVVSKTDAEFVVLPDVYNVDELEEIISFGEEIEENYETTPIVVPKCELDFGLIPESWLVGFSVPSGYSETDVPLSSFGDHKLHLLGGSHRNQIKYANKALDLGIDVFSVDGNAFSKAASYGNIINHPDKIISSDGELDGNAWAKDVDGYTDWNQRICQSLSRYYELWRLWATRSGLK